MDYFKAPTGITKRVKIKLDKKTFAVLCAHAKAAGRSPGMQACYMLEVTHNECLPDPGDAAAARARYVFRGIYW